MFWSTAQRAERTIVVENLPVHATEKQILQLYPGHTALIACDESGKPEGWAADMTNEMGNNN